MRCTKNKIEIFDGETMVAVYDKSAKTWTFTAKNHVTITCTDGPLDLFGKPIKFNGGGPEADPFQVKG